MNNQQREEAEALLQWLKLSEQDKLAGRVFTVEEFKKRMAARRLAAETPKGASG